MASGIALDTAGILSTVLEGILYGFSLLMFFGTVWVLVVGRTRAKINKSMLAAAVLFLILCTIHIGIDITRIEQGLVIQRDTYPGGPKAFFADVSQPTFVFKSAIFTLQTLLGDGIVIYRCYIVWQSFWIIFIPCILWCSVAATGVGTVYSISQATTAAYNIFDPSTGRWITSFFATTFGTNLLSTLLLAYRIWSIDRSVARASVVHWQSSLRPLIKIIVDSGFLYSVTLLAALSCFLAESRGQYVILDMIMPIISIVFYLVIIRVGIGNAKNKLQASSAINESSIVEKNRRFSNDPGRRSMNQMQVRITTSTETDGMESCYGDHGFKKIKFGLEEA